MNPRQIVWNIVHGLGSVIDELSEPLNLALGFVLSPLPRRYWRGVTGPGILLSGLLQVGFSIALLVHTYTGYAQVVSDALADATIAVAAERGDTRVNAAPAMAFGALTPLSFFAVSTSGRVLAYLLLSGVIRVLGYASDHPCGDPVLTFVDDVLWDVGRGARSTLLELVSRARDLWNR